MYAWAVWYLLKALFEVHSAHILKKYKWVNERDSWHFLCMDIIGERFEGQHLWLTVAASRSFRIHSMVLMVMTTASELSLVQGTWMRSSWMCPLRNVKGSFSSCKHTVCQLKQRQSPWKEEQMSVYCKPPHVSRLALKANTFEKNKTCTAATMRQKTHQKLPRRTFLTN